MRDDGFDEFVAGWTPRLLRSAYLLTGDQGHAEDLLQDVFYRLYVAWPRVSDPGAYAQTVLARQAISRWRTRTRRPPESPLLGSDQESVRLRAHADSASAHANREVIVSALAQLTRKQRAVVVLRYFVDLSEADTAEILNCSVGTVKSQTARALARLRVVLPTLDDSLLAPGAP